MNRVTFSERDRGRKRYWSWVVREATKMFGGSDRGGGMTDAREVRIWF